MRAAWRHGLPGTSYDKTWADQNMRIQEVTKLGDLKILPLTDWPSNKDLMPCLKLSDREWQEDRTPTFNIMTRINITLIAHETSEYCTS